MFIRTVAETSSFRVPSVSSIRWFCSAATKMSITDACRKVASETKVSTVPRFAPKTSHQSIVFVEPAHRYMQGLARCYQTQIETNTGLRLSATSPAIPFAVRYADGRTPFQYLLAAPYASPLCVFGESVFALILHHEVRAAKLTNRWISGCLWGRDALSDEHKKHLENSGPVAKRVRHVSTH